MPSPRTNTIRIENLEDKTSNVIPRLDVQDILIEKIKDALDKWTKATETHASKILER